MKICRCATYSPVAATGRYRNDSQSASAGRLASATGGARVAASNCARSASFACIRLCCQLPATMQAATTAIAATVGTARGRNLGPDGVGDASVLAVRSGFGIDGRIPYTRPMEPAA